MESAISKIYDDRAASYGFDIHASFSESLKYSLIRAHSGPTNCVLDVGCANGIYLLPAAALNGEVHGIDISSKMLRVAAQQVVNSGHRNVSLQKASATCLGFQSETFDVVYSFSTLSLVPDAAEAINEIHRVLKPGGFALIDITGNLNLSRWYWSRRYRKQSHSGVTGFRFGQIRASLVARGFAIHDIQAIGLCDQWNYIPGLRRLKGLEPIFHQNIERDLDSRVSNLPTLRPFANRWYFSLQKPEAGSASRI